MVEESRRVINLRNSIEAEEINARNREMSDNFWYTNGGKAKSDKRILDLKNQLYVELSTHQD